MISTREIQEAVRASIPHR